MHLNKILKVGSIAILFASGVAIADDFVSQNTAILAMRLQNFCNEDKDSKLHIADLLMEQIAKTGLTEKKTLRRDIDPNLFRAGDKLLTLAKRIYANKETNDRCQTDIATIIHYLEISNFDKKSEDDLLTKSE